MNDCPARHCEGFSPKQSHPCGNSHVGCVLTHHLFRCVTLRECTLRLSETGGVEWPFASEKRFFHGSKIFLDIFARLDIEQTRNDMTFGHIVTAVHNRRRLLRCSEFVPWFEDTPQRQSWRSHKKSIFPRKPVFATRSDQGRDFGHDWGKTSPVFKEQKTHPAKSLGGRHGRRREGPVERGVSCKRKGS